MNFAVANEIFCSRTISRMNRVTVEKTRWPVTAEKSSIGSKFCKVNSAEIHLVIIGQKGTMRGGEGERERGKNGSFIFQSQPRVTILERLRLRLVIVAVEGIPAIARIVLWKRQGKMSLLPFPPLLPFASLHPIPFSSNYRSPRSFADLGNRPSSFTSLSARLFPLRGNLSLPPSTAREKVPRNLKILPYANRSSRRLSNFCCRPVLHYTFGQIKITPYLLACRSSSSRLAITRLADAIKMADTVTRSIDTSRSF